MPLGTCSAPTPLASAWKTLSLAHIHLFLLFCLLVTLSLHAHFFHADVTVVQAIVHWKISFHPPQTSKLIPNYLTNPSVRSKCPQCLGVFGILTQAYLEKTLKGHCVLIHPANGATVGMCCLKPISACKPGGTNPGLTESHVSIVLLLMFSLLLITSLNPTKDKFSHKIMPWHIHSMVLTSQWQQGNKP